VHTSVWPGGCATEELSLGIRCGGPRGDPGVEGTPLGEPGVAKPGDRRIRVVGKSPRLGLSPPLG
jgi:hypothetical protein